MILQFMPGLTPTPGQDPDDEDQDTTSVEEAFLRRMSQRQRPTGLQRRSRFSSELLGNARELAGEISGQSSLPDVQRNIIRVDEEGEEIPSRESIFRREDVAGLRQIMAGDNAQLAGPGEDPEEVGFWESLQNGLTQGGQLLNIGSGVAVEQIGRALGEGAEALGSLVGSQEADAELWDTVEEWGRRLRVESGQEMARLAQTEPEGFIDESAQIIGQALPLFGVAALSGGAGSLMAGLSAGGAGAGGAAMAGSMGPIYLVEKGALQNDLEADPELTTEEADFWSSLGAIPIAAAEGAFEGLIGLRAGRRAAVPRGVRATLAKRLKTIAKSFAEGTGMEGITEPTQEAIGVGTQIVAGGETPSRDEFISMMLESARAGATAGGVLGGGATFVSEAADFNRQETQQKRREAARAYAMGFDPSQVEPGTELLGRRVETASNGQRMWRATEEVEIGGRTYSPGQLTPKPTPEEIERTMLNEVEETRTREDLSAQQDPPETIDLPVPQVARRITDAVQKDIDPAVVELNIHDLSINFMGSAVRDVRSKSEEEIKADMAVLETMATDPTNELDYGTRVTAMARKRALARALRNPGRSSPEMMDTMIGARALAQRDSRTFESLANMIESDGNELQKRQLRQARHLRATEGTRFEGSSEVTTAVRERLNNARTQRTRGLTEGSKVATPAGSAGEVVNVRDSGFVEVLFEGEDEPTTVNTNDLMIIPEPEQNVRLSSGEPATVLEVEGEQMRVQLPDDSETVLGIGEIETVGDQTATNTEIEEAKAEAAQADQTGDNLSALIEPVEVIDVKTGQRHEITALGAETVQLSDGSIMDRNRVQPTRDPGRGHSIADITETGRIPVFEAGTQPSQVAAAAPHTVSDLETVNVNIEFSEMSNRQLLELRSRLESKAEVLEESETVSRETEGAQFTGEGDFDAARRNELESTQNDIDRVNDVIRSRQQGEQDSHINFLVLDEAYVPQFEEAVKNGNMNKVGIILDEASARGGGFFVFPQPTRPGTKMYGIELLSDAREPTDAGKRALRFLGGDDSAEVYPATLMSTVNVDTEQLDPVRVGVMQVPEGLRAAIQNPGVTNQMSTEELRQYMRRLTDLGFNLGEETADAIAEAAQASAEAADARIDGRVGEAEVAEIRSQMARASIGQAAIEEEVANKREIWNQLQDELREAMTETERDIVDGLNRSLEEELQRLPGVGPELASRIVDHRKTHGPFQTVEDLLEIPRLGERTLSGIRQALESGQLQLDDIVTAEKEQVLKTYLDMLPGRMGSQDSSPWLTAFEHPEVPGMTMVIDKESIPAAEDRGQRLSDERLRQMLGGMQEIELPSGETVERDPVAQLSMDEYLELTDRFDVGRRDVYHIRFFTPEGNEVHARTVSTDVAEVQVPAHLAIGRRMGQEAAETTPLASRIINRRLADGESLDEIVEDLRSERRTVQKVHLEGRAEAFARGPDGQLQPVSELSESEIEGAEAIVHKQSVFTVIDQEGDTVRLLDDEGTEIQVPASQVSEVVEEAPERMLPIQVPRRLTPSEVLDEVVREMRDFDHRAKMLTLGEWTSQVPGVYGEIRPSPETGGYIATIMEEPMTRQLKRPRLYELKNFRLFNTREEAAEWLESMDFAQNPTKVWAADTFKAMPPVDELAPPDQASLPDRPGQVPIEPVEDPFDLDSENWDMIRAERVLTKLLRVYQSHGYVPQNLKDYAVQFALRWHQLGLSQPGGVFAGSTGNGRSVRRMLNLFEVREARKATQFRDEAAQTRQAMPDAKFKNGRVVIPKRAKSDMAGDPRVFDGILLDNNVEVTHPAKIETAKRLHENFEHQSRFFDMADVDGQPAVQDIAERLVEIGPERRLGIIVDSQPGRGSMTVQTFEGGEPTVSKVRRAEVTRVRSPDKALDYYRAARDGMGEMTNLPKTPEIGQSPLDKKLGLDLVQDRAAYFDGLRKRINDILQHVKVAEDGNLTGDPSQIDNLVNAYIRMQELDIPNMVHPEVFADRLNAPPPVKGEELGGLEGRPAGTDIGAGSMNYIAANLGKETLKGSDPLIPPQLQPLVEHLAYQEIANQFSNISPYGEVMAKAKLDKLTNKQVDTIDRQAREFGIDPSLPTYRKVEELMQNVWDPSTAHLLFQIRRDAGMLRFQKDAEVPMEIRMPSMGSNIKTSWFGATITFPREMGYRHPTIRIFHHLAEKFRTRHGNRTKRGADVIKGLQAVGSGMNLKRKEIIWDLLQDEGLGDAQENPADILERHEVLENLTDENRRKLNAQPDAWDWYHQYRAMRQMLTEALRLEKRNALVRGFHPREINFESDKADDLIEEMRVLKQDYNLSEEEARRIREEALAGNKVYDLDRTSNAAFARPRDQVEAFLNLQERYRSLDEVPNGIRETMEDWMVDEFDFWARYGINNYAPRILQGRHKIFMENPDGPDRLVGFAPDGQTAQEFAFRAGRGQVEGIPQGADFYLEIGKARADDVDMEFLGPKRFSRLYARLAKELEGTDGVGAELMGTITRELKLGSEPASPRDVHLEARKSDLSQIIEDPYERMLLYWARVSRNNFLLDIEHAYQTARDMDAPTSQANGLDAIFPDQRYGEMGHGPAQWYMQNLRDSYMGKPPMWEKVVNRIIGVVDAVPRLGRQTIGTLRQRMKDKDYDLFTDPTFLDTLYNRDYSARRWAESMTGVQSVIRLGLNISGAAINATQHIMFTPAYLVARGASVSDAIKWSVAGYKDAINYWRSVMPERFEVGVPFSGRLRGDDITRTVGIPNPLQTDNPAYADLARYAEDAGVAVVPARGVAGPGLGIVGEGTPMFFSDDGPLAKMGRFTEWAMMQPFHRAERSVRLASTFASRRMAKKAGMRRGAAVQLSRDVVDNTQFQYYDQALPPWMRGSAARVLFQFQQFPLNAIKFEKDLILSSMPERTPLARAGKFRRQNRLIRPGQNKEVSAASQARKAWLLYNATGLVLGGGGWFLTRPFLSPLSWLSHLVGGQSLDELALALFGGGEEQAEKYPGPVVGDPEIGRARDFVLHGLPGLAHLAISARLGVSGLEIDPTRARDMLMGPSGSMYADTWELLMSNYRQVNDEATYLGLALGEVGRRISGVKFPLSSIAAALAATEMASHTNNGMNLSTFIANSEAGRRWFRSMAPVWGRGLPATIDMFDDDIAYDANFQQRRYPGAMNKLFEAAAGITGFQPVRSAEERAFLQYKLHKQEKRRQQRMQFASVAANLARKYGKGSKQVAEVIQQSVDAGATIDLSDVQRVLDRRQLGPAEKVQDRGSIFLRSGGRTDPSGQP